MTTFEKFGGPISCMKYWFSWSFLIFFFSPLFLFLYVSLSQSLSLIICSGSLSLFSSGHLFTFWLNVIAWDHLITVYILFALTYLNQLTSWVFAFIQCHYFFLMLKISWAISIRKKSHFSDVNSWVYIQVLIMTI